MSDCGANIQFVRCALCAAGSREGIAQMSEPMSRALFRQTAMIAAMQALIQRPTTVAPYLNRDKLVRRARLLADALIEANTVGDEK